jgi:dTMP kinase
MSVDYEKFRNKLLISEGSDSCGKSTTTELLVKHLNENGIPTILTFQPGDSAWGTEAVFMRSLCKDKRHNLHPMANLFAFLLDRVQQTSKIVQPALDKGLTVISDRWTFSTIAYQLYGKELINNYGIDQHIADWLISSALICREPDMVLYFSEKINSSRPNDANDNFETAPNDFQSRVDAAYETMFQNGSNWLRVPLGSSAAETMTNIVTMVGGK